MTRTTNVAEAGIAILEMEANSPASWMLEETVALRTPHSAGTDRPLLSSMLWRRPPVSDISKDRGLLPTRDDSMLESSDRIVELLPLGL